MADFDNRLVRGATSGVVTVDAGLRAHMLRVYNYMVGAPGADRRGGLADGQFPADECLLSAGCDRAAASALQPTILGWVVLLAPLGLVFFLSFRIQQMSLARRRRPSGSMPPWSAPRWPRSCSVYTGASIAMTFFVTAATFGAMSLWGYTTGRDLTGFGSLPVHGPDRHHHRHGRELVLPVRRRCNFVVSDSGRADLHRPDRL